MWLATKLGFFSIVKKGEDFHVRARVRADLEALCTAADLRSDIREWPAADYRFRILTDQAGLNRIFAALAGSVTYPNFKGEIGSNRAQVDKLRAYENLWLDLRELQEREAPGSEPDPSR